MLCCSSTVPFAPEVCSQASAAPPAEERTAKKDGSTAKGTTQSHNQGKVDPDKNVYEWKLHVVMCDENVLSRPHYEEWGASADVAKDVVFTFYGKGLPSIACKYIRVAPAASRETMKHFSELQYRQKHFQYIERAI